MDITVVRTGLTEAWTSIALYAPRILGALLIVAVGWIVASLLRKATGRLLSTIHFDRVLHAAGVSGAAQRSAYDPQGLIAGVVYWL
ncbi:MAG: hypothetical protein M3R09_08835, partial [Actinomycetota bacterium]|nr:hypothetical protein [Actinomycetota bacterium]